MKTNELALALLTQLDPTLEFSMWQNAGGEPIGNKLRDLAAALDANIAKPKEIEASQDKNWKVAIASAPVPVLYTDSINGQQVLRDDLWLATTGQLKSAADIAKPEKPHGWMVSGAGRVYFGLMSEVAAQQDAKHCGGTAKAYPIYTTPQEPAASFKGPEKWAPEEVEMGNIGIRWVNESGVHGRPTECDIRQYLERTPTAKGCNCHECKQLYTQEQAPRTPYGWQVQGLRDTFKGGNAEQDAKAEAARVGGTAYAFPIYIDQPKATS